MHRPALRRVIAALAVLAGALATSLAVVPASDAAATVTTTGLSPGEIKHVWMIVLSDKSFAAAFTGLNDNTYLSKTLRAQGVLVKDYYATGHFAMDDYISLVSGQAPQPDTQNDCAGPASDIGSDNGIDDSGRDGIVTTPGVNYGQVISKPGPNAPETSAAATTNGCVYPLDVPTLFNQLNAAGVTWKGYAQDLGNVADREQVTGCGYPGGASNNPDTDPTDLAAPSGDVTSFTAAQPNDEYVASHFPFPWFHSLTGGTAGGTSYPPLNEPSNGGTNCDGNHIANLDSPSSGLEHDLQQESTTPAFSWISPDACSDGHDQVCQGNNLSGAFTIDGAPNYAPAGASQYQPETTTPVNYTGGLFATDLFLEYYIPLIEASPAFADGGLIDITFDEATPPFTYSGNSFNNANAFKRTAGDQPNYSQGEAADLAGENIAGRNHRYEPTGPMTPLARDPATGYQLYPGPGDNAFIDRTTSPGPATHSVDGEPGSSTISDDAITAKDVGRVVTDTVDSPSPLGTTTAFVGPVTDTGPLFPTSPAGPVVQGSFQLVDSTGKPIVLTGRATQIILSGEQGGLAPGAVADGRTADPLFDPFNPTPGGGRVGSLLIGPAVKANTSSTVHYNHYSWLRTMEDIFDVAAGNDTTPLTAGSVSGGLDGKGHLGFAAQPGLWPFGSDVFGNERHPSPPPSLPSPGTTGLG
ncbi:MAG TPA: hypothetical protein VG899_00750 [Mycobacteriales bacterium]|nr:hypothetical protein [Mycobacteriales bacterium]HWB68135.1 hypothetical protein [Mycobacteriales bacterium]